MLATVELYHLICDIHPPGSNPEPGLDAVFAVEAGWLDQHALERELVTEVLLGQRWSLVRRLWLRPDQDHPPVEALPAEGGRRPAPAKPAPTITNVSSINP